MSTSSHPFCSGQFSLRAVFPDYREIAQEEAKAAFNISNDAGEAGRGPRVDDMLDRWDMIAPWFISTAAYHWSLEKY